MAGGGKDTILQKAIDAWLEGIQSERTRLHSEQVTGEFVAFIQASQLPWEEIFTIETLKDFQRASQSKKTAGVIRALSFYLYDQQKIAEPILQANYQLDLPDLYEEYLDWYEKRSQVPYRRVKHARRVLCAFHLHLERPKVELAAVTIGDVDAFLAGFQRRFSPATCLAYRSSLRSFLKYLYQERKLLRRDLAPLLGSARQWAQGRPPKFLRPPEVEQLFGALKLSSAWHIRTAAMVHLAYTLGLRPKEISRIRLDDISFSKAELTVPDRKGQNPLSLPLPEQTVKAIAAYLIGVRPKSKERTLFLTLQRPQGPVSAETVVGCIAKSMRQAGVPGSAYWLRHTYAQQLLETGVSVFEIKMMMGHERIESTKSYLHIHTKLMREVLFDETL